MNARLAFVGLSGILIMLVGSGPAQAAVVPADARGTYTRVLKSSAVNERYDLVGRWTLVVKAATFELTSDDPSVLPFPPLPIRLVRKGVLELRDPSGSAACRRGTYGYTVRRGAVRFTAVKERCSSRRALMEGSWRAG